MTMGRKSNLVTALLPLLCCGFVAQAGAGETLAPILVTAERLGEEDPQTVPLAVTALDGETLRKDGITDLNGVAQRTPGLTVTNFNVGHPYIYIRGIGSNEDGAGGDGSVGVFLDEVYIGRTAGLAADLFDLDRVEVLRGPQGTLYGRNVVGGAINLITRKPDDRPIRNLELSLGNLDYQQARFTLSGPVGDGEVYGSLSGAFKRRDGYLESVTTDDLHLGQDRQGLRGQVVFYPTQATEVRLSADYAELDESGPNRHLLGYFNDQVIRPLNADAADDLHKTYETATGYAEGRFGGLALHLTHELDWASLTSITAVRGSDLQVDDAYAYDYNALFSSPGFVPFVTSITFGSNFFDEQAEQFSQEFRLSGGSPQGLQWLGGLYYFRESTQRQEYFDLDVLLAPGVVYEGGKGVSDQDNTTQSYALFGQLGYALDEQWGLTGGARYTQDRKEISQAATKGGFLFLEDYEVTADDEWGRLTPKLSLDYRPSDELFGYLSYSRGYKSGGYQGQAPVAVAAQTPFDPEIADSYELGVKWQDSRMRLSATAFYIDYQDMQVMELFSPADAPVGDVGVLMTFNAADARSQGVELEWMLIPAAGWTLWGSYAYLDATYTDFQVPSDIGFRFTNPVDRSGNRLRNAPRHSLDLGLGYEHRLSDGGVIDTRLEYLYQSKNFQEPSNQEFSAVPAYDLWNLRVAWRPTEGLELAAWVQNLLDEDYLLHNYPVNQNGLGTPAPPRTFGLTLNYNFL
jgi:iron complex outermembrane recepter protein